MIEQSWKYKRWDLHCIPLGELWFILYLYKFNSPLCTDKFEIKYYVYDFLF